MLESVLESVLMDKLQLGDWIEGLDRSKLKIALWKGQIELHDLKLTPTAIDKLQLPLQLHYGYVKTLRVSVPWKSLLSSPLVLELDHVFLIASQGSSSSSPTAPADTAHPPDFEALESSHHQSLIANAEIMRQAKRRQQQQQAEEKGGGKGEPADVRGRSYLERLVAAVVDNLQIDIRNVHVRFEQVAPDPSLAFCAGITIKSISVQTDASARQQLVLGRGADKPGRGLKEEELNRLVFKRFQVDDCAVYWNAGSQRWSEIPGKGKHMMMASTIGSEGQSWCAPLDWLLALVFGFGFGFWLIGFG